MATPPETFEVPAEVETTAEEAATSSEDSTESMSSDIQSSFGTSDTDEETTSHYFFDLSR